MNEKTKRDVFLLLTIIGSFLCLALIAFGVFCMIDDRHSIAAEIANRDGNALVMRLQSNAPVSLFGSGVLMGTWFCYRRYHKLTFGSR